MVVKRIWIWLSLGATILMAASSAAGIFVPATYARETASWASQGVGQDFANLFVVFPAMLVTLHFAFRRSVWATLVLLGLLIYIVYSYILYAFFIHFGSLFPVYVAVLGLSTYALFGSVLDMNVGEIPGLLAKNTKIKLVSVLLIVFGCLFGAQWLSEIVPPLLSGTTPRGVKEIAMPVNPVHVLDLAFILPGMIATGVSIRKGRPLAMLLVAPLLTFSAVMGIAILCMFYSEHARGVPIPAVPIVVISAVILANLYGAYSFLRQVKVPGTLTDS